MAAEQLHDLAEVDLTLRTPNVLETPIRIDHGESIPGTPSRAASPTKQNRLLDPVIFITMVMEMQKQIGEMQGDVRRLQHQNTRLEETLAQSTAELRADRERVIQLTQRLAASEEANRLSQERLQQVRVEMERTTASIQQRQDLTTATLQRVDEHVGVVEAKAVDACQVASRAQETAAQIAARTEGFFAKTDRNDARLNCLQQTLSSVDTLQVGTSQVPLYKNGKSSYAYKEEPDYLPSNVQVGLKKLGQSLN